MATSYANSGAIFHYAKQLPLSFDAVRPGICIYGYSAGNQAIDSLSPLLSWQSQLVYHQPVKKGESVSYGAMESATRRLGRGYTCRLRSWIVTLLSNQMKVRIRRCIVRTGRLNYDGFHPYLAW